MDNLISVIVPVYNAEKYLYTCFKCLQNQTYTHFEVILIDDGSTDKSFEILKKFQKQDGRFKAFTQKNSGVSAARNRGLELSEGEYIAYMDVDDRIKPDYFERLLSDALEHSADIVCCGYEEVAFKADETEEIIRTVVYREEFRENAQGCVDDSMTFGLYMYVVWAKLFKKEIALIERFEPIRYGEDTRYMFAVIQHKPNVYLSSYAGYSYMRWENSATLTSKIKTREYENSKNWISVAEEYVFPNVSVSVYKKARNEYIRHVASYMLAMVRNEKKQEFLKFKENKIFYKIAKEGFELTFKNWVIITSYRFSPRFCWMLIKLLKRK